MASLVRRFFSMQATEHLGPIASSIKGKLEVALQPQHFRLINDSHKHAGHYVKDGSAACDAGETHFRLEVISDVFKGLTLVKRHQMVYGLLGDEFQQGLHALSMTTKAPGEQ